MAPLSNEPQVHFPWRSVALAGAIVAIVALEFALGSSRLARMRDERAEELRDSVRRAHATCVAELRERAVHGCEHARFLALDPSIATACATRSNAPEHLLHYLDSFAELESIALLDAAGAEFAAVRRTANAIARPAGYLVDPRSATRAGTVVDLPTARGGAPRCAASVELGPTRVGTVVLTLDTRAWLATQRSSAPFEGVIFALRTPTEPLTTPDDGDEMSAAPELVAGLPVRLGLIAPNAVIERQLAPLARAHAWILGSMLVVTSALSIAVAFLLRLRLRAFRAHETAEYVTAIRREGAKWKALTESAADMILIVDPRDASIRERNHMAVATLGDASIETRLSKEDYAELRRGMLAACEAPGQPVALRELQLSAADGRTLLVDTRLAGIDLVDERVVEISLRDVTRERALERHLAISERLTSLGLLTAGVAHEINNPLEGIENYLRLLEREDTSGEKRARHLEQVRHGFERIRDIVRDLLAFGRPGVERGEADLAQVVARVGKLVGFTKAFGSVALDVRGLEQPLIVPGDGGRLEQVLLNLLLNAATAMGGKGRITITAERIERGGEPFVRITVDDDGPGIAPENLARIFDPFFSTSDGNGLGLSISYGIVRAHGGTLSASHRTEGGARLVVELPAERMARASDA